MFYRRRRYFFGPMIIIGLIVFSTITMMLWNALVPSIFHLPAINFWQAVGLLILSHLLFGGFRRHGGGWHGHYGWNGWREKVAGMSPEEKKEYFSKWCGGNYWNKDYKGSEGGTENVKPAEGI